MHFNMEYSGASSPNKTPRKKNRSSGYGLPFFPVALPPALVPNLDGQISGVGRLSQYRIPQQGNEQLCLDNFSDMVRLLYLGVTGQGLVNACAAAWPGHLSFNVRWLGVSASSTTCVRRSGRVKTLGGRHMAAGLCAHIIIQPLLIHLLLLPFL